MNKEKIISYIQLINTPRIGVMTFHKLINRFKDVDVALKEISLKQELFPRQKAEEEYMTAKIKNVKLITLEDEVYPYNLKQIEDCPPILYAIGNIDLLKNENTLAIVGARTASLSALKLAEQLSKEVAQKGITVVSGLARGIDGSAHIGAVDSPASTIAVLGTGIDVIYPKENTELYLKVCRKGLILTEYPFHTQAQVSNFPRRNRIVSGLSKATLVVEAGIKSGSLITAHLALEQGRDVMAIPGSPYDGRSAGSNKLIREGALLVESSEDIINSFNFSNRMISSKTERKEENADLFEYSLDNEKNNKDIAKKNEGIKKTTSPTTKADKLLSLVSASGEDVDELIRKSGIPSEEVLIMLMELELEGKIIRVPNNKVAKT